MSAQNSTLKNFIVCAKHLSLIRPSIRSPPPATRPPCGFLGNREVQIFGSREIQMLGSRQILICEIRKSRCLLGGTSRIAGLQKPKKMESENWRSSNSRHVLSKMSTRSWLARKKNLPTPFHGISDIFSHGPTQIPKLAKIITYFSWWGNGIPSCNYGQANTPRWPWMRYIRQADM